jgi:hypothetical protein
VRHATAAAQRSKVLHLSRDQAQARRARGARGAQAFSTLVCQELHAYADSQHRTAVPPHLFLDGPRPVARLQQSGAICEVPDSRQNQAIILVHIHRAIDEHRRYAEFLKRPKHRSEVAHAVIDHPDSHGLS